MAGESKAGGDTPTKAGGGSSKRAQRKRTPRKNSAPQNESSPRKLVKPKKRTAVPEPDSGSRGSRESPSGKAKKEKPKPARESPTRAAQHGGEEDASRVEPASTPEKPDSNRKRTPRKRIVRTSTGASPSPASPSPAPSPAKVSPAKASPAKASPASTPTKQSKGGAASDGSAGRSGGRKRSPSGRRNPSPTPDDGGEGRREVVKIHFPTAQERQAGGSPKLDAFVEVEESPPTTPPAGARGEIEPEPQPQQSSGRSSPSKKADATERSPARPTPETSPTSAVAVAAAAARANGRAGRGRGGAPPAPRAATMVTVGSHGTTMADVSVAPPATPPRIGVPEPARQQEQHEDDQSPPRSLIRKVPAKVQIDLSEDSRGTSPNPPGLQGWTPPSPHSRRSLRDTPLLEGTESDKENGDEETQPKAASASSSAAADSSSVAVAVARVTEQFPPRAPVPSSSAQNLAANPGEPADAAANTLLPESKNTHSRKPQLHPRGAGGYATNGDGGGGGAAAGRTPHVHGASAPAPMQQQQQQSMFNQHPQYGYGGATMYAPPPQQYAQTPQYSGG